MFQSGIWCLLPLLWTQFVLITKKDARRKRLAFKYRHDSCSSLWICSVLHYDTIWQRPHCHSHVRNSTEKNHKKIRNWTPSFHFTASFPRPIFYCSSIFHHSFNLLSFNKLINQLHICFDCWNPWRRRHNDPSSHRNHSPNDTASHRTRL